VNFFSSVFQARIDGDKKERPRIAHVIVNVTVQDVNDNCPMFVNLPYYAVVSVDAVKGDEVTKVNYWRELRNILTLGSVLTSIYGTLQVHAVDLDKGENGEVRYELAKGHGELFRVSRKSGEITLKQSLEGHNREYELVIAAYDGGKT